MKEFNILCGLPRSGSTLLSALLNQNPDFYASTTSALPAMVRAMRNSMHHDVAYKSYDNEDLKNKFKNSVRGMIEGWYTDQPNVIFDKNREWPVLNNIMTAVYPNIKYIFCIRDIKAIIASMYALNQKNFNKCGFNDIQERGAMENARYHLMNNDSSPLGCVLDHILRQNLLFDKYMKDRVLIIGYEDLVKDPQTAMKMVYAFLNKPQFEHDFKNIELPVQENDVHYNQWGDHTIRPKLSESNTNPVDILGKDVCEFIDGQTKWFRKQFYGGQNA